MIYTTLTLSSLNLLHPLQAANCCRILDNRLNFPTTDGFKRNISMELFYQYMAIFLNFSPTLTHLHSLQVENCDSNSRLVVNEDGDGKFRPQRVKCLAYSFILETNKFEMNVKFTRLTYLCFDTNCVLPT